MANVLGEMLLWLQVCNIVKPVYNALCYSSSKYTFLYIHDIYKPFIGLYFFLRDTLLKQ